MDIQHIHLVGNATKDAESLTGKNEKKFTKFSLAVNDYNPVSKESTPTYYDVLIFGNGSEKVLDKVKKGDRIVVDGKPQIEAYLSKKDKQPKASVSVVADGFKILK